MVLGNTRFISSVEHDIIHDIITWYHNIGSQPSENILKFNLPGPLAENMATSYFAVNYLS